jgi:hypothetical protein
MVFPNSIALDSAPTTASTPPVTTTQPIPASTQGLTNDAGTGAVPVNYSSTTAKALSVDDKVKISKLAKDIAAATARGDQAAAAQIVQEHKAFIDGNTNASAALTEQVKANLKPATDNNALFDLMFLAARAVIEGLNKRQGDSYWSSLNTALKGVISPAKQAATTTGVPGLD